MNARILKRLMFHLPVFTSQLISYVGSRNKILNIYTLALNCAREEYAGIFICIRQLPVYIQYQ